MADSKKYFWLKLKEDFFNEKLIKFLRSLPDGDKLVIVYLKMQLKSLRTEGFIKYDQILPSSEEELAMVLDEDKNVVGLTLNALLKAQAVERLDDGSFYMIAMQNLIGKEGESAERVRKFREKQTKMLHCNADVTKCNTEIEKEIELEKETDIEAEKEIQTISTHFSNNIHSITPFEYEQFEIWLKTFSSDVICKAINIAVMNNVRTMKYIDGILKSWKAKGYKSLQDIENENVVKKPDWFDKGIEKNVATEEEQQDIENLLKELY